ncbi:uncharacterized protein EV154DRAFT_599528 [Mucor mucedo]|uniref:uncharacterized protein n=1 Tax=Mucor mucedo TaxID=29922 RepID=UPI00221E8752|nr:uncharacterized protein EV154DRAFT_599528 [Mucor mucedo]KAI7895004.1 hypothetical protein EV154DRAFT_599528 [Mucor mucedo]
MSNHNRLLYNTNKKLLITIVGLDTIAQTMHINNANFIAGLVLLTYQFSISLNQYYQKWVHAVVVHLLVQVLAALYAALVASLAQHTRTSNSFGNHWSWWDYLF